jgi:hypothetical protein
MRRKAGGGPPRTRGRLPARFSRKCSRSIAGVGRSLKGGISLDDVEAVVHVLSETSSAPLLQVAVGGRQDGPVHLEVSVAATRSDSLSWAPARA